MQQNAEGMANSVESDCSVCPTFMIVVEDQVQPTLSLINEEILIT